MAGYNNYPSNVHQLHNTQDDFVHVEKGEEPPIDEALNVSLNEMFKKEKRIVRQFTEKSRYIASRKPKMNKKSSSWYSKLKHAWNYLFSSDDLSEVCTRVPANEEQLEKNKKKLKKIFDSMREQLDKQCKEAEEALEDMSEAEQEEFLKFWTAFSEFFMELFNWLKGFVERVVERIKQGQKINPQFLKELFQSILDALKTIFE